MLRVEPEIPGVMVDIFGGTIQIRGATQGQTTYTVFVSGEIQDIFGQKLGDDDNLTFRVGPAEPVLIGPDESLCDHGSCNRRSCPLTLYDQL